MSVRHAARTLQDVELMGVVLARVEQPWCLTRCAGSLRAYVRSGKMGRRPTWGVGTGRTVGHGVRLCRQDHFTHAVCRGVVQTSATCTRTAALDPGMSVPGGCL